MTNKEYKKRLEDVKEATRYTIEQNYNGWTGRTYNAYLSDDERKDLRYETKTCGISLNGSNGRACVKKDGKRTILQSYWTDVCEIRNGRLFKTWDGYSVTTAKHIDLFLHEYGFPTLSKMQWVGMEANRGYTKSELDALRKW